MCIKDMKNIKQHFHSVAWVIPGAGLGGTGVKNLNVGICDGAPSTAHSSCFITVSCFFFPFYLIRVLNSSRSGKAFCFEPDQGPHCLKRL